MKFSQGCFRPPGSTPAGVKGRLSGVFILLLLFFPGLAGCDLGADKDAASAPGIPPRKPEPAVTGEDLTADQPGAVDIKPKETPLLEPLVPTGPVIEKVRRCYKLLAEMKTNLELISADLDNSGKEVTRLINTSDDLTRNITALAALWPENESFRDKCGSAKREALVLNEELAQVPRKWPHVRWAFTATLQSSSKLRLLARTLADAEPQPVPLLDKHNKPVLDKKTGLPIYVDPPPPPQDPDVVKREKSVKEVEKERERIKKIEEEKKNRPMRINLDDN